jgi:hypothetical protein
MLLLPLVGLALGGVAVDMTLVPNSQVVYTGCIAEIDLVLSAGASENVAAVDVILSWNPAQLELIQAIPSDEDWFVAAFLNDPDGINDDVLDGLALYTALVDPPNPLSVPPSAVVATFQFRVIASGQVGMIAAAGAFGKTRVISTTPGAAYSGTIAGPISITALDVASQQVPRLGVPANPNAFLPGVTNGPVVGTTWDPIIDHSSFFPGSLLDLMAIAPAVPINVPTVQYGTFLCDIFSFPYILRAAPPGFPFSMVIPNDCSLIGLPACSQAASLDLVDVKLTNALDLVIGTF